MLNTFLKTSLFNKAVGSGPFQATIIIACNQSTINYEKKKNLRMKDKAKARPKTFIKPASKG